MKLRSDRRDFIKKAAIISGAVGMAGTSALAISGNSGNPLPPWNGFNLLDFFSPDPSGTGNGSTEEDFKWMSDWGFDFVRIPMAYPAYLDIDRTRDISPDEVYNINQEALERIIRLVFMALKYGMHVSLNLHRAPGYCINAGFREPFNLWKDAAAQEAFYWHWQMWARRYKSTSRDKIGFALWNFRGSFGILDSGREDVDCQDWYGRKLDRKLLDLIQKV